MAQLALPSNGMVYLDANAFIYSIENVLPYWIVLQPLWKRVQNTILTVVTSELTLLEVLVKPLKNNDKIAEKAYRSLFTSTGIQGVPINQQILEHAARLRANTRLRTPDAIHAATALDTHCALCITNDRDYKKCPSLHIALLDDFIKA